jgi:hypothetical protein
MGCRLVLTVLVDMQSFLWGMGMAVAFSIVGVVFSSMEEVRGPASECNACCLLVHVLT